MARLGIVLGESAVGVEQRQTGDCSNQEAVEHGLVLMLMWQVTCPAVQEHHSHLPGRSTNSVLLHDAKGHPHTFR